MTGSLSSPPISSKHHFFSAMVYINVGSHVPCFILLSNLWLAWYVADNLDRLFHFRFVQPMPRQRRWNSINAELGCSVVLPSPSFCDFCRFHTSSIVTHVWLRAEAPSECQLSKGYCTVARLNEGERGWVRTYLSLCCCVYLGEYDENWVWVEGQVREKIVFGGLHKNIVV